MKTRYILLTCFAVMVAVFSPAPHILFAAEEVRCDRCGKVVREFVLCCQLVGTTKSVKKTEWSHRDEDFCTVNPTIWTFIHVLASGSLGGSQGQPHGRAQAGTASERELAALGLVPGQPRVRRRLLQEEKSEQLSAVECRPMRLCLSCAGLQPAAAATTPGSPEALKDYTAQPPLPYEPVPSPTDLASRRE